MAGMRKYRFELVDADFSPVPPLAPVIHAASVADAAAKFARKHGLDMPAWWDEPSFEREMDMVFTHAKGSVRCRITW